MNIAAYRPFTLMDYPGKIAALVFTQGCNFSCGYCHNPALVPVLHEKNTLAHQFLAFLATRRGKLQGVVVTGGEPTSQAGLIPFLSALRQMGFAIKLDTNGSFPRVLEEVIQRGLVDYIAMDIKGTGEKYRELIRVPFEPTHIATSIRLIIEATHLEHEFRTTAIKPCLSQADLIACGLSVRGAQRFILQAFVPTHTLDPSFQHMESYSPAQLRHIQEQLLQQGVNCQVR